jgi:bacterioferritin (cytochrome b1)
MNNPLTHSLSGTLMSSTLKRPGEPAVHAVKTEGPLGDLLKRLIPESGGHAGLGSIVDECCEGSGTIEILNELAGKKYQLILAYIHYGDQLRAMYRDGIYEHFQEHLEEERAQLYQINKKVTALGGDAPCCPGPVPTVALNDARAMFHALMQIEEESVRLWSSLFHQTDDDVALNGMAQTYATECQGHTDDLKRYLRSCE